MTQYSHEQAVLTAMWVLAFELLFIFVVLVVST